MGGQVTKLAFPGVEFRTAVPRSNEVIWLIGQGGEYNVPCWHLKPKKKVEPKACIVYCHGNAMAISEMRNGMMDWVNALNCVMVVPEIPGAQYDWGRFAFKTGQDGEPQESERMASEDSYYAAGTLAVEWARKQYPRLPLIVWGQSLGTGCATELAVKCSIDGLVLQSPLMSAVRVAFHSMPTLPFVDIFVNISKVPKLTCPTLIMHGAVDDVIHVDHGKRLASLVPAAVLKELRLFDGAGHNDMELLVFDEMRDCVSSLVDMVREKQNQKKEEKVDDGTSL